jgi:hypothetical protein
MNRRKKRAKRNRRQRAQLDRDHRNISAARAQEPGPWGPFDVWREVRKAVSALITGQPRPTYEKPRPATICRDCQATNDPGASECWLCGRRDWRGDPASPATKPVAETADRARLISFVETILIVLALAVVGAGAVRLAPGLGIAFLILLVPAWIITEKKARSQNQPMSAPRKFAEIVWWMIVIPFLLALSLPALLVVICTGAIGLL